MRFLKSAIYKICHGVIGIINYTPHPRGSVIDNKAILHKESKLRNLHGGENALVVGQYSHIRGELTTFWHGGCIVIGSYCYVGENTKIWSAQNISIGNRVLISHNVNIFDNTTHPISDPALRHMQFKGIIEGHPPDVDLHGREVIIHDDVLIASNAVILPGVTIGEGAVIGAGSVVTKDVPPHTLAAGNPACVVRQLQAPPADHGV